VWNMWYLQFRWSALSDGVSTACIGHILEYCASLRLRTRQLTG
jgi:hypothetical protein